MIFKVIISSDAQWWIGLLAIIHSIFLLRTLRKYSPNFGMSMYIFVASALVLNWMCNGIRQFVVAIALFAATEWILKNRWIRYLLLVVIMMGFEPIYNFFGWGDWPWFLGGVHQSVIIMIPIFFCVQGKPLNWRLWVLLVVLVGLVATGSMNSFIESSTENTTYVRDLEYVFADTGTNIIRCLVPLVPVVLVLIKRREILNSNLPPVIALSINMAFVTAAIYLASSVTSGIYVGRLPVYCELYNLILIPWLIQHPYKNYQNIFKIGVYVMYGLFFFYQVGITWSNNIYECTILDFIK